MDNFLNTIPGVEHFRTQSTSKKIFWAFVFAGCTLSTVIVTINRIKLYLEEPVNFIYEYELNDAYVFPSITICPSPAFDLDVTIRKINESFSNVNVKNIANVYQLLKSGVTIEDIWKNAAENISNFLIGCYFTGYKNCTDISFWEQRLTILGPCYTITITENMSSYETVNVVLRLNDSWCPQTQCPKANGVIKWKIMIHNRDDDITYKMLTHGHVIPPEMTCHAIFEKTNHEYKHSSKRPCQPFTDFNKCESHCSDLLMAGDSKCRLPFMKTLQHLPLCRTPGEFHRLYPMPRQFFRLFKESMKLNCRCHQACSLSTYKTFFDSWQAHDPGVTKLMFRPTDSYGRRTVSQQFSYNFIKLLCDIGAVFGFHMSISLLTLAEIIEYAFDRIVARHQGRIVKITAIKNHILSENQRNNLN